MMNRYRKPQKATVKAFLVVGFYIRNVPAVPKALPVATRLEMTSGARFLVVRQWNIRLLRADGLLGMTIGWVLQ